MSPRLILGTSIFSWTVDRAVSWRLLDRFAAAGGTVIDTADCYGDAEAWIGEWLHRSGMRDAMRITTKVGLGTSLAPATILKTAETSLSRMGIDTIDLLMAHRDDPDTPQEDTLAAFAGLIETGKVRAIGASAFPAPRLASALSLAETAGLPRYGAVQYRYNLLSRGDLEGPIQQLCRARDIAIHPFFPLARGFLTGKYRTAADLTRSIRGGQMADLLTGRPQAILAAMDQIASETGATLAEIALAWLTAQPGVTAPVASATSIAQLDELLAATRLSLTPDQIARLTAASA